MTGAQSCGRCRNWRKYADLKVGGLAGAIEGLVVGRLHGLNDQSTASNVIGQARDLRRLLDPGGSAVSAAIAPARPAELVLNKWDVTPRPPRGFTTGKDYPRTRTMCLTAN